MTFIFSDAVADQYHLGRERFLESNFCLRIASRGCRDTHRHNIKFCFIPRRKSRIFHPGSLGGVARFRAIPKAAASVLASWGNTSRLIITSRIPENSIRSGSDRMLRQRPPGLMRFRHPRTQRSNAVARAQGIPVGKRKQTPTHEPYLYGSGALVRSSDWKV